MKLDAFNSDMSRAASKRKQTDARVIAPEWNGQAVPSKRQAGVPKSGSFKVHYSGGVVVIKKTTSPDE